MDRFHSRPGMRSVLAAALILVAMIFARPSAAADMAAGCCDNLEDRVSELEATVAAKGNRSISLQLYGQINKALLVWDDGAKRDAYIVDNSTSSTRVGFIGESRIKPGWSAGYRLELELKDAAS